MALCSSLESSQFIRHNWKGLMRWYASWKLLTIVGGSSTQTGCTCLRARFKLCHLKLSFNYSICCATSNRKIISSLLILASNNITAFKECQARATLLLPEFLFARVNELYVSMTYYQLQKVYQVLRYGPGFVFLNRWGLLYLTFSSCGILADTRVY